MTKTIMIVDDEADVRKTTKEVLEKEGYKVIEANDGDDCLRKLRINKKPDLILIDIMMPGTPVNKIIPKLDKYDICYLSVIRTSDAEKEDLSKGKNIKGYINKPYNIKELLKKVNEACENC